MTGVQTCALPISLPFDSLYQNSTLQKLSGGSPAGGTFIGDAVINGAIKPAELDLGNYTVTYQYSDANGCAAFATDVFTVIPRTRSANLFPNPSLDGNVTLVVLPEMVGTKATAYDAIGRKVQEWIIAGRYNTYKFNWASGVYTLVFTRRKILITKRLEILR